MTHIIHTSGAEIKRLRGQRQVLDIRHHTGGTDDSQDTHVFVLANDYRTATQKLHQGIAPSLGKALEGVKYPDNSIA